MLCSISKLFVVACVGVLVEEGELQWNRPVSDYLPGFTTTNDPNIGKSATFVDILRHSAGLSNPVVSILGPYGKVLLPEKHFLEAVDDAPPGDGGWEYSNVGYGIIAMAVQHVSGVRYSEFLRKKILEPLGMHHTAVKEEEVKNCANIAFPYIQLENGDWTLLEYEWTSENNTPVLAAFGMRSSVNDLLVFCAATMAAEQVESQGITQNSEILKNIAFNPLKQMREIRNGPYWTRPHDDNFQTTSQFHLGWMRATIPSCHVSWGSYNEMASMEDEERTAFRYILGQDSSEKEIEILKHTGVGYGSSLSVNTFPGTSSAIVVLCNGLNVGDAADFTAQAYMQELFELEPRQNLWPLMELETQRRREEYDTKVMHAWRENRKIDDPRSPPGEYVGDYRGLGITISVRVDKHGDSLYVVLNRDDIALPLEFYSLDRYSYMPKTRDDWLRGGWLDWDYYLVGMLDFTRAADGKVDGFSWQWDEFSKPSKFTRISEASLSHRTTGINSIDNGVSYRATREGKRLIGNGLTNPERSKHNGQIDGNIIQEPADRNSTADRPRSVQKSPDDHGWLKWETWSRKGRKS